MRVPSVRLFGLLLLIAAGVFGCTRHAQVDQPQRFHEAGLLFEYPGNWRITGIESWPGGNVVFVEGSGGALASITVFDDETLAPSLEDYGKTMIENLSITLGGARIFKITDTSYATDGARTEIRYVAEVLTVKVPHTMILSRHVVHGAGILCMTQAADEDRPFVDPGFDLIRRTLARAATLAENGP